MLNEGLRPFALAFGLALAGCPSPDTKSEATAKQDETMDTLPDRDPQLAKRLVEQEGALVLDVRTWAEYELGHVDNAVQIPHDELEERIQEVVDAQGGDKNKPIVTYCRSGRRSGIAKEILTKHGFAKVTNLGGYDDWPE